MDLDLSKLPPAPWFVHWSESTDDCGGGPAGMAIGPYEDDFADCFLFSETASAAGPPEDLQAVFDFVAASRNRLALEMEYGYYAVPMGGPGRRGGHAWRWKVRNNLGQDLPWDLYADHNGDDTFSDPTSAMDYVYRQLKKGTP